MSPALPSRALPLLLGLGLLALTEETMTTTSRLDPGVHEETFASTGLGALRYTISVPPVDAADGPAPLVLALHYGFDRSAPFPPYYGRGLLEGLVGPALAGLRAVIVAPDSHGRDWTDPEIGAAVLELVEAVRSAYTVDDERTLVTGYSLGGIGTWHLAAAAPARFRAAMPISARPPGRSRLEAFPPIPLHVIHSRGDELFAHADVSAAVQALRSSGRAVEYTLIDGPTHFDVGGFVGPLRQAVGWLESVWAKD